MELKLSEIQNKTFFETQKGKIIDKEIRKVETISNKEGNDTDNVLLKTVFKCDICSKEFKSTSNLLNHDKKFHMLKGTNVYKCDNCNEKLEDKSKLKYHNTKEHIASNICLKIFPTITSLNIHITAVHDNLITNHQIDKEPSLRIMKVAKPQ